MKLCSKITFSLLEKIKPQRDDLDVPNLSKVSESEKCAVKIPFGIFFTPDVVADIPWKRELRVHVELAALCQRSVLALIRRINDQALTLSWWPCWISASLPGDRPSFYRRSAVLLLIRKQITW